MLENEVIGNFDGTDLEFHEARGRKTRKKKTSNQNRVQKKSVSIKNAKNSKVVVQKQKPRPVKKAVNASKQIAPNAVSPLHKPVAKKTIAKKPIKKRRFFGKSTAVVPTQERPSPNAEVIEKDIYGAPVDRTLMPNYTDESMNERSVTSPSPIIRGGNGAQSQQPESYSEEPEEIESDGVESEGIESEGVVQQKVSEMPQKPISEKGKKIKKNLNQFGVYGKLVSIFIK